MARGEAAEDGGEPAARFGAAVVELERELDWELLGSLYCEGDARGFFSAPAVGALREAGLHFASDLARLLDDPALRGRPSLYLGAALSELVPALCEALVLGRRVVLLNLPGPEPDELNRSLAAVAARLGLELPRVSTLERGSALGGIGGGVAHAWMTSVLSDPERFPALHRRLYGKEPGAGSPAGEEDAARSIVEDVLGILSPPAVLTTTDEELPFFERAGAKLGLSLSVPDHGRYSAIVGDPVRHVGVASAGRTPSGA